MTKLLKAEKKSGRLILHYMGQKIAFTNEIDMIFETELVKRYAINAATFDAKGREPGMIADDEIRDRAEYMTDFEARAYNLTTREKAIIKIAFTEMLEENRDYITREIKI